VSVSVCILTHTQPELLPLCVASCFEEIKRAGTAGEVIVIDNASADRYPEKLRETYSQVRIIRNEQNLGFSAGNNIGIRASQDDSGGVLSPSAWPAASGPWHGLARREGWHESG
jgi:GT2 family glycosyltransferase